MPIEKSPTNEYVAILIFKNVSDPAALRYEIMFNPPQVDSGDFENVQVEPIVPHCGHGIN
jgi:hypothetical protein